MGDISKVYLRGHISICGLAEDGAGLSIHWLLLGWVDGSLRGLLEIGLVTILALSNGDAPRDVLIVVLFLQVLVMGL